MANEIGQVPNMYNSIFSVILTIVHVPGGYVYHLLWRLLVLNIHVLAGVAF